MFVIRNICRLINIEKETVYMVGLSLMTTMLVFLPFVGQKLLSDVVTFQKSGDSLMICYPAFIQLGHYLLNGVFWGVDTTSFNGASEFFSRAQLSNMYLPLFPFAYLSNFFSPRFTYIAFFAMQIAISLYFSQKVAKKYFGLSYSMAYLFAISCLTVTLYETWYIGHFIVNTLLMPGFYYALKLIFKESCKWYEYVLYSIPFVFILTAGYIPLSIFGVSCCFLLALLYGKKNSDLSYKNIIYRLLKTGAITIFICLPYYIQVTQYILKVVKTGKSTLYTATDLSMNMGGILNIVSNAFVLDLPKAQECLPIISLGILWVYFSGLIIKFHKKIDYGKTEKTFIVTVIMLNFLLLLDALGQSFPIAAWIYSLVPVMGGMHLPIRYMMISVPFLYLVLCIGFSKLFSFDLSIYHKKCIYILSGLLLIMLCIPQDRLKFYLISASAERELILAIVVLVIALLYKNAKNMIIFFFAIALFIPAVSNFYQTNEVYTSKDNFNNRSIIYNKEYESVVELFANNNYEGKKKIRFYFYDPNNIGQLFVPANYAWYHMSNINYVNYGGHEPHASHDKTYESFFPWYHEKLHIQENNLRYLVDTRADFIIIRNTFRDAEGIFNIIIDDTYPPIRLGEKFSLYKLKKFIPEYYSNEKFLLDHNMDSYDNGYFYSPNLKVSDVESFSTDDATYYNLVVNCEKISKVEFLFYPNKHYKYYIDGKIVSPDIREGQIYLSIPEGKHKLDIRYENNLAKLAVYTFICYYFACVVLFARCFWRMRQ